MKQIPLRLTDEIYNALRKLSYDTHIPMAEHIRAALTEYLKNKEESPVKIKLQQE